MALASVLPSGLNTTWPICGERQLAVPAEKLSAFRKALLAQGYPLA